MFFQGGKIGDVEFEWEAEPFEWTRYEEVSVASGITLFVPIKLMTFFFL